MTESGTELEKLEKALHDVEVAKGEISHYAAGLHLAAARNRLEEVINDRQIGADAAPSGGDGRVD